MGLYDDLEIGDAVSSSGWSSVAPPSSSANDQSSKSAASQAPVASQAAADKLPEPAAKKVPFMAFKPRISTAPAVKKTIAAKSFVVPTKTISSISNDSSNIPPCPPVATPVSSSSKVDTQQPTTSSIVKSNILFVETVSPLEVSSTFDEPDPYDPSRPNDYTKICQEREDRKRQAAMIEENTEYVLELERIRTKRQQERDEAVAKGDLKTLQELAGGAGRGGRNNLSNLPAWMTAQMSAAAGGEGGAASSADTAQFQD